MRKIILLIVCLLAGAGAYAAAPWGAMRDYVDPSAASDQSSAFRAGHHYLMPQLISGAPVRVLLELLPTDEDKRPQYEELIAQIYDRWFSETAQIIRSEGREQEFADVLEILDRGISVVFPKQGQAVDIRIYILPFKEVQSACGYLASGCYINPYKAQEKPIIYLPKNQFLLKFLSGGEINLSRIGMHEVGHSLGLSDQYKKAKDRTSHARYASAAAGKSIMNRSRSITCDDADGIVNLIDIARGTARGGNAGWKSLCPKSEEYYIRGQSGLRGPYSISRVDLNSWKLQVYRNGEVTTEQQVSLVENPFGGAFYNMPETVRERDGLGRPVVAAGPHGEEVYYSYWYNRYIKLVMVNGKAVRGEVVTPAVRAGPQPSRKVYTQKGDRLVSLLTAYDKQGGLASYSELSSGGQVLLSLDLYFDKKGRIFREVYSDEERPARIAKPEDPQAALSQQTMADMVSLQAQQSKQNKLKKQLLDWFKGQKYR